MGNPAHDDLPPVFIRLFREGCVQPFHEFAAKLARVGKLAVSAKLRLLEVAQREHSRFWQP